MTVYHAYAEAITSTKFEFISRDGLRIACERWSGEGPVRGVVQIAHGMGEYIGRYVPTIEVLVAAGFIVYGNDHRGHGHTAPDADHFGDFGEGGFNQLVQDVIQLSRIAKAENPNLPFILLGHSMGAFASQQYVIDYSYEIDGLILSGSGALDELAREASKSLSTNFLNAPFDMNAPFWPARTPFDWLSRDPAIVDEFINDPLCFAELQVTALASFLAAGQRLSDTANLRKIRNDLPIYIFSGSEDPVGQHLEGVELLIDRYRKAGICDITRDFYLGGRHEMLNEINREEVRANLLTWIFSVLEEQIASREIPQLEISL
jgi:alpha-beta hydrolase superfamily lysophospholipase